MLPPAQFPIRDLPPDHPIFRMLYDVPALPQIPSINSWRGMGGGTSELGEDSAEPHIRAITDRQGRIMVLMTHNTDISDAWEREAADPRYFLEFSPQRLRRRPERRALCDEPLTSASRDGHGRPL